MGILDLFRKKPRINRENSQTQAHNAIRLIYVKMTPYKSSLGDNEYLDKVYYISSPYSAPEGLNFSDICKTVSYATKRVIGEKNTLPFYENMELINYELERDYGFNKIKDECYEGFFSITQGYDKYREIQTTICHPIEGVTDLFIVAGDKEVFKRSPLNNRYFNWYDNNVTKQDIINIYSNNNVHLNNIGTVSDNQTLQM